MGQGASEMCSFDDGIWFFMIWWGAGGGILQYESLTHIQLENSDE